MKGINMQLLAGNSVIDKNYPHHVSSRLYYPFGYKTSYRTIDSSFFG